MASRRRRDVPLRRLSLTVGTSLCPTTQTSETSRRRRVRGNGLGIWHPCSRDVVLTDESAEDRVGFQGRRPRGVSPSRGSRHRAQREARDVRREGRVLGPASDTRRSHADGPGREGRGGRHPPARQQGRSRRHPRRAREERRAHAVELVAPLQEPPREAQVGRRVPSRRGRAEPSLAQPRQRPVERREDDAHERAPRARLRAELLAQHERRGGREEARRRAR